jgi:hypothetical protein
VSAKTTILSFFLRFWIYFENFKWNFYMVYIYKVLISLFLIFFFFNFLGEVVLFIEENPIWTKKKFCRHFMTLEILSARFLKNLFKLETSPFGSLKGYVMIVSQRIFTFLTFFQKFWKCLIISIKSTSMKCIQS